MAAKKSNGNGNGKAEHRRQEVQQAVKNACDQLNSDGVAPRDYVEQLAWLFFLKAFDEAESRLEQEASFDDRAYVRRLDGDYRWSAWAKKVERPDDMLEFVDGKLWRHLQTFGVNKGSKEFSGDPVAERFRRIFSSVRNHSRRGASFARVVQQVNRLHFSDETDVVVLSEIYEDLLKRVAGDSAGYAGEFYTQRHIIRAMVEVVQPKIGERVYDPCFGTAGFLSESAEYIRRTARALSGKDLDTLNQRTFFGVELKPLTYLLGIMNMLLHRIERANLEQANTLELHTANVSEKNKYDVILANPPYGGKLAQELQTNFTIRSGATEILFLQHIMANLKKGGRAGVIVPEGVLFRGGPDAKVRERLLTEFDLHTILSLPAGCFLPYTPVKTYVLFFDRRVDGRVTERVYYYELENDGFDLTLARSPIAGSQLPDFDSSWRRRKISDRSWMIPVKDIAARDYSLRAANPRKTTDYEFPSPDVVIVDIRTKQEDALRLARSLEEVFAAAPHSDGAEVPELTRVSPTNGNGGVEQLKRALVLGRNRAERQWLRIGDLVECIPDTESVTAGSKYRFAGVKSFGRGAFLSAEKSEEDFRYRQLRRVRFRDFIYPKLMAWEGAFAMVPRELDGCVVSPEFVLFRSYENLLLPEVLDTYFRSPLCLHDVQGASRGSNKRRRRLNPKDFLELKIPVPPRREQLLLRRVYEFEAGLQSIEHDVLTSHNAKSPSSVGANEEEIPPPTSEPSVTRGRERSRVS